MGHCSSSMPPLIIGHLVLTGIGDMMSIIFTNLITWLSCLRGLRVVISQKGDPIIEVYLLKFEELPSENDQYHK